MRRPISLKIFSIAIGLLVLMVVTTYLSNLNLREVKYQGRLLSAYYIPIEQDLESARLLGARQVIYYLELLQHLQGNRTHEAQEIAEEKRNFEQDRNDADKSILDARSKISNALIEAEASGNIDQVRKLSALQVRVNEIPKARDDLNQMIEAHLADIEKGKTKHLGEVHRALDESRQEVGDMISAVTELLQRYTVEAAARAADLERRALTLNWAITIVAGIFGLLFAALVTRNLVEPVKALLKGTKAVEQGNLNIEVQVHSADEIASLADSFNHMVTQLKQKESIKDTFGKYVDPRIVKGLLEDPKFTQHGVKRVMTVLFCDLVGFTSICELLTPEGAVKYLNQYFSLASEPIRRFDGVIDKYIGDAIMAFWGPPFCDESEHPKLACFSALEQLSKLPELRQSLSDAMGLKKGIPSIALRIGIATGDVTVGNIGSAYTKGYTVIGDTVNLASRLESVNKQYGTRIIISEHTWTMAKDHVEVRELDCIRVVGKTEPARLFELLARKGELAPATAELREYFAQGLDAYRRRDWEIARTRFDACLKLNPGDTPSRLFISRIHHWRDHPPVPDWDGVWNVSEK